MPPSLHHESSDASLLRAWRDGDPGAFKRIVSRHQGPLLRHATALLGRSGAAEDAVQDAFLTLARTPPDLSALPEGADHGLGPWLHRVTRNRCLDVMRADTRRREREGALGAMQSTGVPGEADRGLAAVDASDTRALVERTLHDLPDDQREAVTLRLLHEKSYAEIAAITGRKVGTVGWLISQGMKALSAKLSPLLEA